MFCNGENCTQKCPAYENNTNMELTCCKIINSQIRANLAKRDAYNIMGVYWNNKS